ncbi:hypothetical protein HNQ59_000408 [Chitinivorax tropicus]|uniref:Uncharacterized protein n=1 Tax=Chitinivorax tropicus TaxID=714531 RepID=A0A840MKQ6_9PROT|nr:hypothetical protein [Chitinivorax tropicus]MBB5017146.1 hypothetical protein [Chitinivorax tropicus]
MRKYIIGGLVAALLAAPAFANTKNPAVQINLTVRDTTPKFVAFYDTTTKEAPSNADRRWVVWRFFYDYATPANTKPQERLETVYPKYAGVIDGIRGGFSGLQPNPQSVFSAVVQNLYLDKPVAFEFNAYVGMFESGIWSNTDGKAIQLYLPLEQPADERAVQMPREIARVLYQHMKGMLPNGPQTVVEGMLFEGIAAHVAKAAAPSLSDAASMGLTDAELKAAESHKADIIKAVRSALKAKTVSVDGVSKPTVYGGWLLVADLMKRNNVKAGDIARKPLAEIMPNIEESLGKLAK